MFFDIFHTVLGQRREIKPDLLEFLLQKVKGEKRRSNVNIECSYQCYLLYRQILLTLM